MRSKASYDGHPIHPALIPFPLAFLIGALAFDVAGVLASRPAWWMTGGYLAIAGIVAAVVAAVPGFIDYMYTVPPNSTGKKRATKHMLVNLGAVALFAAATWLRGGPAAEPALLGLALEAVGAALLTTGGWMGGVLVSRNQISVDHRYAGAGKWRDERVDARAGEWFVAARSDELAAGQMKLLRVDDRRVVVARTETGWAAFEDHCTHRGGSLAGGSLICGTVQCPWHGSQFDVVTGAVKAGPAGSGIRVFEVAEGDGNVRVRV